MCVGSKTFTIERYGGESELCEWSTEKNVCFRSSVFYAFIQFFVVACSLPKTIVPLIYCCITLLPYQTINIIHILWRRERRKRWCSGMYVTPTLREVWGYIKYNLIYVYELTQVTSVDISFLNKMKNMNNISIFQLILKYLSLCFIFITRRISFQF